MASRYRNFSCPACAKNFTQTGFQSHLRQTKDPHCAAFYANIVNMEAGDQEAHVPFEGDVFGGHDDYIDDDFGDPEPRRIEDDEEQEDQDILENGWEPERPGARAPALQNNEDAPSQPAGDYWPRQDEQIIDTSRGQAECRIAEDHFIVRYSEKYPDRRAGAPMKKTHSGDFNYRAALNNSSNPWAPFSSRMDWDIAKWAKLRGATSTAFSDLLAIEGVSDYCVSTY